MKRKLYIFGIVTMMIFMAILVYAVTTPPIITIESPTNTTYDASVWFNVSLNEDTDWCGYSLNGATNISMNNDTTTHFYAQNTTMIEGSHYVSFSCNDSLGNMNTSGITEYFTVDTTCPSVSAYYQWDATNTTVDFGLWTEGFVSVNWNVTDSTGINTSSCIIKVRNKNIVSNNTKLSIVDDVIHPDYDTVTGYKTLTCYSEDMGDGTIRVSANMSRSYDWRPLITAFDQDSATHDNTYSNFGSKTTKIVFHNITDTIDTTFIFLADIDNQTNTVADLIFYSCNSSYTTGDFTTSPYCVLVGAVTTTATRDVNFGYLIGALTTDENGTFGGVVHTETMYGMSYCPDCTNTNNAWLTYSTNGYDGHSATSSNGGTQWTDLSGEEFNVILHTIDNTQLEFNLTINDTLGNQLSDLRTDTYGALENRVPFGDIMTDEVAGSLVSYHDVHDVTETGTIWINATVSDPNADSMNCSVYLLNNDSSVNQTLLSDYAIEAYGICPYEWDTTTIADGDYRLNVTAFDGSLTGYDESAGYLRIDNTAPVIVSFISPATDNLIYSYPTSSIIVNISFTETNPDTCLIAWAGTNYTATISSIYCHRTFTVSSGTSYTYSVYLNDTVGFSTTSSTRTTETLDAGIGAGGGSGGITTAQNIPTIQAFETVNPVIVGGKSTLKCIYQTPNQILTEATVTYTFDDGMFSNIQEINGVYTKRFTFNKVGNISWTCKAYQHGYEELAITRHIIVLDETGVQEYLAELKEEIEYNETYDLAVNYNVSILDEEKGYTLAIVDDLLEDVEILNGEKDTKNIGYLLLFLIVVYILMPKKKKDQYNQ